MANKEILILGGGAAGLAAALESKKLGNIPHILTPAEEPGYRSVYTVLKRETEGIKDSLPDAYRPLDNFYLVTSEVGVRVETNPGFVMIDYPQVISRLREHLKGEEWQEFSTPKPQLQLMTGLITFGLKLVERKDNMTP